MTDDPEVVRTSQIWFTTGPSLTVRYKLADQQESDMLTDKQFWTIRSVDGHFFQINWRECIYMETFIDNPV